MLSKRISFNHENLKLEKKLITDDTKLNIDNINLDFEFGVLKKKVRFID